MSHSNYRDKNWGGTEATNNDSKKGKDLHNNEMSGGKDNTRPTNPWNRPRPQFAGQPSQEGDIGPQDPTNQSDSAVPTRGGKVPMSEAFEQGKFRPRSGGRGRGNYRGGGRSRWQEHPDDMYNDSEGKDEAFSHMERRQSEHSDRARGVRGDFRGRGRNGRGDGHASQQYQQSSQDGNNFWGGTSRGRNNWHNRNSFRDSAGITQKGNNELPVALEGIVPVDAEEREILELFAKTKMNTGINFTKYQAIPVKCVPENVNPMETFESMNLEQSLMENVKRAGYTRPTPIQKYALPIVTRGRDLMACAQTGSGKTAAFLIPIIQEILSNGKARLPPQLREKHKGEAVPSSMILAPTRELTLQIHDEARKFCFRTGLRSVVIYGGVDSYTQRQELHRGCDIVVATPGRLWDLYLQGCMLFACVRTVILDEADRMLDLGFEEQIRHIMQNSDLPPTSDRQTLLFSATFPSMIQTLAKNYLRSYFFVTVGRVGSTTEGITQRVGYAKPDEKLSMVENLLQKDPNVLTLIFVERKSTAEDLKVSLMQASFRVDTIHGDRHQLDRERALNSFRNGDVTILVATDVASRGLDIPNVGHVIQYDMPSSMDDYIHRIGRTGRAGNVGLATAIFTDDDARIATELVEILREHNQSVPEWLSDVMLRTIQDKSRNANYRHRR